jgi:hypothetical protein
MRVRVGRKHEEGAVYIGRPSPLGNPFVMKSERERAHVCDQYEEWFATQVANKNERVLNELRRLYKLARSRDELVLGCFCAPKRCHGDTIKAFLEKHT